MAIIDTLKFQTAVDLAGLRTGVGQMIDMGSFAGNKVQASLGHIKPAASGIAGGIREIGSAALAIAPALAGIVVAGKAFEFLKDGIKASSDLNESISKTDIILGQASGEVKTFADELANKFGVVKTATLDIASEIGGLGQGLGNLSGDKLAGFTKQFTMLAADVSSIKNIDMKAAGDALRVGLSGEQSDVLKGMGVILTENTVKAYAYANGIAKSGEQLTEQQKLLARAGIISSKLAYANNNLRDTINDPANAYRRLQGTIVNLTASIGTALMPAFKTGLGLLNNGVASLQAFFERNKASVEGFGKVLSSAFTNVGAAIQYIWPALSGFQGTFTGLVTDVGQGVLSILPSFTSVTEGVKAFFVTMQMGYESVYATIKTFPDMLNQAFGTDAVGVVGDFASSARDWLGEAFSTAGFAVRNFGDVFSIAQLQIGQQLAYLIDTIALIPTNLKIVADFVAGNWVEVITAPFKFIGHLIEELAKSLADFLHNPSGGISLNTDAIFRDFTALKGKLPELVKPELLAIDGAIQERFDSIAKNEQKYRAKLGKPFELAKPAESQVTAAANVGKQIAAAPEVKALQTASESVKPIETKHAGALELGSSAAYSAIVKAADLNYQNSMRNAAQAQIRETAKTNEILTRVEKGLAAGESKKTVQMVI